MAAAPTSRTWIAISTVIFALLVGGFLVFVEKPLTTPLTTGGIDSTGYEFPRNVALQPGRLLPILDRTVQVVDNGRGGLQVSVAELANIAVAVRARDGSPLSPVVNRAFGYFEVPASREPRIEIYYKRDYFLIEVTAHAGNPGSYDITVSKLTRVSGDLKSLAER